MPHMPRPPSIDRGVTSLLWAIGLGAYWFFGSKEVRVPVQGALAPGGLGTATVW